MSKPHLKTLFENALMAAIDEGEPPRSEWVYDDAEAESDFRIFCMGRESMLKDIEDGV